MMREGKDPQTIRAYIDATYSQYGPSTDTPPIGGAGCTEEKNAACGDAPAGAGSFDPAGMPAVTVPEDASP